MRCAEALEALARRRRDGNGGWAHEGDRAPTVDRARDCRDHAERPESEGEGALAAHLAACARCRAAAEDQGVVGRLLASWPEVPEAAVRGGLEEVREVVAWRAAAVPAGRSWLPAAAVGLLVVGGVAAFALWPRAQTRPVAGVPRAVLQTPQLTTHARQAADAAKGAGEAASRVDAVRPGAAAWRRDAGGPRPRRRVRVASPDAAAPGPRGPTTPLVPPTWGPPTTVPPTADGHGNSLAPEQEPDAAPQTRPSVVAPADLTPFFAEGPPEDDALRGEPEEAPVEATYAKGPEGADAAAAADRGLALCNPPPPEPSPTGEERGALRATSAPNC